MMKITGEEKDVNDAISAIDAIATLSKKEMLTKAQISTIIEMAKSGQVASLSDLLGTVAITAKGKVIRPKSLGQKEYVDAIRKNKIVFGIGPAGTGKTYLAVALAVTALKNHDVERIILTRPAVEAGEKLGFLPGDLAEKVDPYLRPIYDALQDMMGGESYLKAIERGSIEIAPLAYMRGRTLSNSFIILDEAQNTTREQMKMFLTRMGEGSKIVVTGDITQIDLPHHVVSGMKDAVQVLEGVEDIKVIKFDHRDVVRHELVSRIIRAYEKADKEREQKKNESTDK
ncbi:MAG: PhoH family protein [Clostridia bacterium]|nr:PhoH family protein [Clostridia bacterium]MBO7326876.1 PhoH family protein [Clostridia bacterium]